MKTNQKGFSVVEILIVIVVVGLLGAVGWLVYDRQKSKTDNKDTTAQTNQQEQKQEELKAPEATDKRQSYTHPTLKFSLKYPESWKSTDVPKPEGFNNVYETVKLQSPDFESKSGPYGGTIRGALITVHVRTLTTEEKNSNVDEYINGEILYTSQHKAVTLGGQKAAEFIIAYEGPKILKTLTYKDGMMYELTYSDVDNPDFQKYLSDYKDLVSSFSFN